MNSLTKVKLIQKLNEEELKKKIPPNASWHMKYKESAYIYIGGFPYELTEGDIVIICSQYGEIVDCRIARDKDTGKSKGFGFVCYEDQRSTILAVDNLNGANICGRIIRVDHVEKYKIPKEYLDISDDNDGGKKIYKPTGPDGKGWGEDRILSPEDVKYFEEMKQAENNKKTKIKQSANEGIDSHIIADQDEKWENEFLKMVNNKKEEESKLLLEKLLKKKKKREKREKKKLKKQEKLNKELQDLMGK